MSISTTGQSASQLSDAALEGVTLRERYCVESRIGKGGMAWVYRGSHVRLGGRVAVKILFSQLAEEEDIRKRFLREAQFQYELNHPHIVRVLDLVEERGIVGVISEWCNRGDLKEWIEQQGGRLPLAQLSPLFFPVLDAMAYVHKQGFVHRDLKPQNIMLHHVHGRLVSKVTDFGVARKEGVDGLTSAGAMFGTIPYMSPEQIQQAHQVDARADIYSLGVVLYELLSGRRPFEGVPTRLLMQILNDDAPVPEQIPEPLREVILQCLAKEPEERFPTCEALKEALVRALRVYEVEFLAEGEVQRAESGAPLPTADGPAFHLLSEELRLSSFEGEILSHVSTLEESIELHPGQDLLRLDQDLKATYRESPDRTRAAKEEAERLAKLYDSASHAETMVPQTSDFANPDHTIEVDDPSLAETSAFPGAIGELPQELVSQDVTTASVSEWSSTQAGLTSSTSTTGLEKKPRPTDTEAFEPPPCSGEEVATSTVSSSRESAPPMSKTGLSSFADAASFDRTFAEEPDAGLLRAVAYEAEKILAEQAQAVANPGIPLFQVGGVVGRVAKDNAASSGTERRERRATAIPRPSTERELRVLGVTEEIGTELNYGKTAEEVPVPDYSQAPPVALRQHDKSTEHELAAALLGEVGGADKTLKAKSSVAGLPLSGLTETLTVSGGVRAGVTAEEVVPASVADHREGLVPGMSVSRSAVSAESEKVTLGLHPELSASEPPVKESQQTIVQTQRPASRRDVNAPNWSARAAAEMERDIPPPVAEAAQQASQRRGTGGSAPLGNRLAWWGLAFLLLCGFSLAVWELAINRHASQPVGPRSRRIATPSRRGDSFRVPPRPTIHRALQPRSLVSPRRPHPRRHRVVANPAPSHPLLRPPALQRTAPAVERAQTLVLPRARTITPTPRKRSKRALPSAGRTAPKKRVAARRRTVSGLRKGSSSRGGDPIMRAISSVVERKQPQTRRSKEENVAQALSALLPEPKTKSSARPLQPASSRESALRRSCRGGQTTQCLRLAEMLSTRTDVAARREAFSHFYRACLRKWHSACRRAGDLVTRYGQRRLRAPMVAIDLWKRACEHKDAVACESLGLRYKKGFGGLSSRRIARYYFQRACRLGLKRACR